MYIEAEKSTETAKTTGAKKADWLMLEEIVRREEQGEEYNQDIAYTYLSTLLGRTYEETVNACERFAKRSRCEQYFHITHWLGKLLPRR